MLRFLAVFVFALLVSAVAPAQSPSAPALPYSPSLDLTSMDRSVDPCVDFYTYSCGGWQKRNPIPADQTSWSVYAKLYQDNLQFLRGILEEAAAAKGERNQATQEVGDFYGACNEREPRQPARPSCHSAAVGRHCRALLCAGHCAPDRKHPSALW